MLIYDVKVSITHFIRWDIGTFALIIWGKLQITHFVFFQSIGLKASYVIFVLRSISIFCILNFLLNHFSKQFDANFNSTVNICATAFLHLFSEILIAQPFS